ncbi:MAG TPA: DedA family protein [Paracoccaceae bacterium]|nr:DedA family protein [Paracoccaceae bacterium]
MENWVTSIVESMGYAGVVLLMFFENLFPPIPSEVVMPLSGYTAAQGQLSIIGVIVAGTFGSVLGAIFWYYVARWLGEERLKRWARKHGRWITLGPSDIDKADDWFDRYGAWVVFFGRLVPTIRTLVAIPAGLFGMPLGRYLIFTTLGSAIWTGALALIGWWLGSKWSHISTWMDPFTYAVMGTVVIIYVYRVVTFERTERKAEERRTSGRR